MLAGIMLLAWLGSPPISPAIGKQLPRIDLAPLVNTSTENVATGFQGKLLVLYLWGPWNSASRSGVRKIGEIAQRFEENPRIHVVLVACPENILEPDDLRRVTQEALNDAELQMPVYYDPNGQTNMELALLMPYGSLGFPTTIVADESGKVVRVIEGESEAEFAELQEFLIEYGR